uniref:GPN-loop GTPase 2 n=1 Tax=Malurus cyaneus samueli TaxID=2593467 RepID=A0A8C5UCR9_9PASS
MAEGSRGGSLAFGQVVIGPPGSGKTTYCHAMREFLSQLGRSVAVVNLDPANESLPHPWGAVGPAAAPPGCRALGGFPLLHRPWQVHLSALHLPVHHAARGAAPHQRPVQDGPDRAVRQAG